MNVKMLKHDFKGNIRNQVLLSDDLFLLISNDEEIDPEVLEDIRWVQANMSDLWDKIYLICEKKIQRKK